MDVIQPQFIWIDNRCYRKNPLSSLYADVNNVPLTDIEEKGKHLGSCI
jgi:hypothetical protein